MCDQLVTPTALAACTRVDSCFTPWFVPAFGVSVQFAYVELHLCHHLNQLGTGMSHILRRLQLLFLHLLLLTPPVLHLQFLHAWNHMLE